MADADACTSSVEVASMPVWRVSPVRGLVDVSTVSLLSSRRAQCHRSPRPVARTAAPASPPSSAVAGNDCEAEVDPSRLVADSGHPCEQEVTGGGSDLGVRNSHGREGRHEVASDLEVAEPRDGELIR